MVFVHEAPDSPYSRYPTLCTQLTSSNVEVRSLLLISLSLKFTLESGNLFLKAKFLASDSSFLLSGVLLSSFSKSPTNLTVSSFPPRFFFHFLCNLLMEQTYSSPSFARLLIPFGRLSPISFINQLNSTF